MSDIWELHRWLSPADFRAMGYQAGVGEIDYGMRWGDNADVRVSYSPYSDRDGGYLYAHDRSADRYLLLATDLTQDVVDSAWRTLSPFASGDAYLALASLNYEHGTMPVEQSRALHRHCVERELAVLHNFATASNENDRGCAAHRLMPSRAARRAAEDLLADSIRLTSGDAAPVFLRYRVVEEERWDGRLADVNTEVVRAELANIIEVARGYSLSVQATSVTQGWTTVAASRSPEFAFAARVDPLARDSGAITI